MPRKPPPRRPPRVVPDRPKEAPTVAEPEQQPTESSVLTGLAQLAGALSQEAMSAEQRDAVVNDILGRIQAAPPEIREALFKKPSVRELVQHAMDQEPLAPQGALPGTYTYKTINGDKVPWGHVDWSWADLLHPAPPRTPMPVKTWVPAETILLGWNGLFVTVHADEETTLPEVFYGEYMEHRRNERLKDEHARFLFKRGPRPSDPSIVTPDGMRARSIANEDVTGRAHTVYAPGGGMIPEWSPDLLEPSPEEAAAS